MIEADIIVHGGSEISFVQFINILKAQMDKTKERRRKPKTGRRRAKKKWWDADVREAIQERKNAAREHRRAKSTKSSFEKVEKAWARYLECKKRAATLVQEKIRNVGLEWVREIGKKDKSAPRKFWAYVKGLGKQTESTQQYLIADDGTKLNDEQVLNHIERTIASAFQDHEGTKC